MKRNKFYNTTFLLLKNKSFLKYFTCTKPKHISSCFIYFMPLASFYNPCKHQITSSFLIYRLFAEMSLSTVGYLRDLCLELLVKRRVRFASENSCYKKVFFANECKYFYTLCKRRSERWHLHDWGCYLLFSLAYMFKELIFANKKNNS